MFDIKLPRNERYTHCEYVDLTYEKITWHYIDGNIIHSDTQEGTRLRRKYVTGI